MPARSLSATRQTAWRLYRENPVPYLLWLGLGLGLWGILELSVARLEGTPATSLMNLLLHVVYLVLISGVEAGVLAMALGQVRGREGSWRRLFTGLRHGPALLVAKVLVLAAIAVGLALLVVPGMLAAARLGLFGFVIVDTDRGPADSIRRSAELTRGRTGPMAALAGFALLINLAGAALLGLGLLVTLPLTLLMAAVAYEDQGSTISLRSTPRES